MSDTEGWCLLAAVVIGGGLFLLWGLLSAWAGPQEATETMGFGALGCIAIVCLVGIAALACLALTGKLALIGLE